MAQSIPLNLNRGPVQSLHLSGPGLYRDAIENLKKKYPNLRDPDCSVYANDRRHASVPKIACFDFTAPNNVVTKHFQDTAEARTFLEQPTASQNTDEPVRRLFLLQGLDPECVSLFGTALEIDPILFMRHQRTSVWERSSNQPGNTPKLASLLDSKREFVFEYPELRRFHLKTSTFATRCAENGRNVSLSRQNGEFDHVGVLQRKLSFWSQEGDNKGWTAIMIVDEPLRQVVTEIHDHTEVFKVDSTPYEGGYADIIKYKSPFDALLTDGPPRTSMFNDICYYLEKHPSALNITPDPRSATTFAQKIIASHFLLLAQYTFNQLSHLEWQLTRRDTFEDLTVQWVEERWSDLWTLHTRLNNHRRNVDVVLDTLEPGDPAKWINTRKDFKAIELRLLQLKAKSDGLIASFAGLASMVSNRQSLVEARTVRLLTILGMTFLPLSFTSGLFSMAGSFTPGASQFWVYFAVSIPLVLLIFSFPMFFTPWYIKASGQSSNSSTRRFSKASKFSNPTKYVGPSEKSRLFV